MSEKKTNDWISAVIIEDDDDINEELGNEFDITPVSKRKPETEKIAAPEVIQKRTRNVQQPLKKYLNENISIIEAGIDEAGRGPMFGRVYAGVVVLPKDDSFDHSQMKDSKKFHSKKKIEQVANYIKENAIVWAV